MPGAGRNRLCAIMSGVIELLTLYQKRADRHVSPKLKKEMAATSLAVSEISEELLWSVLRNSFSSSTKFTIFFFP